MRSLNTLRSLVIRTGAVFFLGAVLLNSYAYAEQLGQSDFDEAVTKKLNAKSEGDLLQVTKLIESALSKGLTEEDTKFAKEMLGAIFLQRGQQIIQRAQSAGPQAAMRMRDSAIESLNKSVLNDPTLDEAHLLLAKLYMLGKEDRDQALYHAGKAIELRENKPKELCEALLVRGLMQVDKNKRGEDLDRAVKVYPENMGAWQARGIHYLDVKQEDAALVDFKTLMDRDPKNVNWVRAATETLRSLKRFDEARQTITAALERMQDPILYIERSKIAIEQDDDDQALADLDKAIELQPQMTESRLMRAELLMRKDDTSGAKRDIEAIARENPDSGQAILLRAVLAVQEGRLQDAIQDMSLLAQAFPDNSMFTLQLASYYLQDRRSQKTIETIDRLLERDPHNWEAFRIRGDARLNVGDHAKALEDYESALQYKPDDKEGSGLYNNVAWVLATSPKNEVRDGKRSLEYASKAAALTEYKEAHILSTLAAAHAELGDFDEAIKWSTKAVEIGKEENNEQLKQLEMELEGYRKKQPFRELQENENKVPLVKPGEALDT